jgi:hypothetical protein
MNSRSVLDAFLFMRRNLESRAEESVDLAGVQVRSSSYMPLTASNLLGPVILYCSLPCRDRVSMPLNSPRHDISSDDRPIRSEEGRVFVNDHRVLRSI